MIRGILLGIALATGALLLLSRPGPAPAAGGFLLEGPVLTDPDLHNLEILPWPGGGLKMFLHRGHEIFSALATEGTSFRFEPGTRLEGSMPATIRLPDGRWRMYFSLGPHLGVGSAVSADGLTFTREPGERLSPGPPGSEDEWGQVHLALLPLPDGRLRMFYDAQSPSPKWLARKVKQMWRTCSAVTSDGLTFVREPGARMGREIANAGGGARFMITWSVWPRLREGRHELYTTAVCFPLNRSGIWRAESDDGLHFRLDDRPTLSADDVAEGGVFPEDPFVVETPEGERLFYWMKGRGTFSAFRRRD